MGQDGSREREREERGRVAREWEAGMGTCGCGPLDAIWAISALLAHPTDTEGRH